MKIGHFYKCGYCKKSFYFRNRLERVASKLIHDIFVHFKIDRSTFQ